MSRANLPLPDGYPELLDELKRTVADTRWRAQRVVNTELINHVLAHRTDHPGSPGDRDVRHLGHRPTLRRSPGGLSRLTRVGPRSLRYMRSFALAWPDEVWQQAAAKLPWGHIMVLLDKLDNPAERDWYAAQAVEHGWSRNVLLNQIMSGLHTRALGPPSPTTVSLQPRLADIPRLERDSGHDVTLDLRGVQGQDWAEPTQRAAYRTVQEALTNVSKHAPGAPVTVSVEPSGDALHVTVSNGQPASPPPTDLPTGGHGLAGLRERARLLGGNFHAGPASAGGFRLEATLPNVQRHANSVLERRDGSV